MVVSDQSDNPKQGLTWGTKTEAHFTLDHYLKRKFSLKCLEVRYFILKWGFTQFCLEFSQAAWHSPGGEGGWGWGSTEVLAQVPSCVSGGGDKNGPRDPAQVHPLGEASLREEGWAGCQAEERGGGEGCQAQHWGLNQGGSGSGDGRMASRQGREFFPHPTKTPSVWIHASG